MNIRTKLILSVGAVSYTHLPRIDEMGIAQDNGAMEGK